MRVAPPQAFVAGLHLRWDGVWQRPHHLLTRLARRLPVVVVEEPHAAAEDRDEIRAAGAVTVIRPLRRRGWSEPLVDAQALASARALVGERSCGVWLYTPMMTELIDVFAPQAVVYDAMDDLASFDFAPAGFRLARTALGVRGKLAGHHGGDQERDQRDPVLRVVDFKRADRREEVVVEPEHRHKGGDGGLQEPEAG